MCLQTAQWNHNVSMKWCKMRRGNTQCVQCDTAQLVRVTTAGVGAVRTRVWLPLAATCTEK